MNTSLRFVAAALGGVGALIELYVGATTAIAIDAVSFYSVVAILFPLIAVAGAVLIYVAPPIALGTGIMIAGVALQHNIIEIKAPAMVPLAVIALSTIVALAAEAMQRPETPPESA